MKKIILALALATALAGGVRANDDHDDKHDSNRFEFKTGTLVLSRSVYTGTAATVKVGQTLPPGCLAGTIVLPTLASPPAPSTTNVTVSCSVATADGTFPTVFNNNKADGSFGVSSPIFLDNITGDGWLLGTLAVPTDQIVTSFSSKSELALNRSLDGKAITFVGYHGGPGCPVITFKSGIGTPGTASGPISPTAANLLDVSNSNTPGVCDPTNPVVSSAGTVPTAYYRAVAEVNADGHIRITDGNAYSGNNGRAAIKANWLFYMVGNDNNGGLGSKATEKPSPTGLTNTQVGVNLITSTGVELLYPDQVPPIPPGINKIGDFEISQLIDPVTNKPFAPDKAGKDNNYRGLTIFDDTLYVTKGSGGNGVNTVYQVGKADQLPTGNTATFLNTPITILPGFPTFLATGFDSTGKVATPVAFPFGIWFANEKTLYVCDEGDGTLVAPPAGSLNVADAATLATAGVQKWTLGNDGNWHMDYVLQKGLNIGVPYSVTNYPSAFNPATDGCRNITGRVNRNGTVTIWAVTSTISKSGDQGADPNLLVKVTDVLKATTLPTGDGDHDRDDSLETFVTVRAAQAGEVLRGISFAPTEHDSDRDDQDGDQDGHGRD